MKAAAIASVICGVLLAVSLVAGGGKEKGAKAEGVYAELGKAPEKARGRVNPLEKDAQAVAAGRLLFADHCAECHGENAEGGSGRKKGPNLRAPEVQSAAPGAIFWLLTNGVVRKGMPVWSRLPEPQRWQLVAYIKSLGASPAAPEQPSPAPPKPAAP